jgi:hypothetical protein
MAQLHGLKMSSPDITVITDLRFSGGTASALIADVMAFRTAGATVGLLPVTSGFFSNPMEAKNSQVLELTDLNGVTLLSPKTEIRTKTAFFHHPLTFYHGVTERLKINADISVVVAHHPPFRGDGSLEYDPIATNRTISRSFGVTPLWAPVSGVIRRHLRSFLPLIRMTSQDWVNIFDETQWRSKRPVFEPTHPTDWCPTIGRHGRSDVLKWPDTAENITAPLRPSNADWQTRVMGCPVQLLTEAGADLTDWNVLSFNQEPVDRFLDSLDVFSYFYSTRWVEAFGRTMVEAMLMERPCVLDPRLQETFGELAQYCQPTEAPALMDKLRQDPQATRARAKEVRRMTIQRYSGIAMPQRLNALQHDQGTISRKGSVLASPLVTLRKTIGLSRRRRSDQSMRLEG